MNSWKQLKSLRNGVAGIAALALVATISACSTSQLQQTTNLVSSAVGIDDPEKAGQIQAIGGGVTSVASSASPLSFETERGLGGGIAIRAFSQVGPEYPNAEVQRYVNLVGRVVAAQSSRPDLPYAFAVIDSPVPNAFAGPGGYIFVTTGSLRYMSNEAELAGVLAHEVAHVTELHMVKTWRRTNLLQGLSEVAAAADEDAKEYTAAVDQATETLFDKGLDKSFEYEADTVGVDLAALAGYDPAGLPNFLNKLASATDKKGGWYSTHPPLNERIGRLNQQVADLKVNGGIRGVQQPDRFFKNVGHLFAGQ